MTSNTKHDIRITEYLSRVTERLVEDGYTLKYDVAYSNYTFICVAKRSRLQVEFFGLVETFYMFYEFSSLDYISLREFSNKCMRYARRNKTIPWLIIPVETVVCFPVAIVSSVDNDTIESLSNNKPKQHYWSDHEMPVIYDLKSNRLHYSNKTPFIGRMYYDHFRAIIQDVLSP